MSHWPIRVWFAFALMFPAAAAAGPGARDVPAPVGTRVEDFQLNTADGQHPWSLARDAREAKAVVVLFLGTECPINNAYLPFLKTLHTEYSPKGVAFVGINSNGHDTAAAVARHAKEHQLPFVVLKDEGAGVADRFAARRTPEAFILDGSRTVRYRGRIDDRFGVGVKRLSPTRRDLAMALDEVLAGKEVTRPATEVAGCPIGRPAKARTATSSPARPVTYSNQVARIIQNHCQECHRPGEVGPFKLMTYKHAAAWSEAIREVVAERRMPPWPADPAVGKFSNARSLSEEERQSVLAWIDQGSPEGDPKDLPPPRTYVDGWNIGKPDEVITMPRAIDVPAQSPRNGIPYQYVLLGEPLKEDKWVRAVECRPGNRAVVHHIIVYVKRSGNKAGPGADSPQQLFSDFDPRDPDSFGQIMLAAYAPGDQPLVLPAGMAKRIPKGGQLFLEIHYTPNGTASADRSSIGLIYADGPPRNEVRTRAVDNQNFIIPPLATDYKVVSQTRFDKPAVLLSLSPHMHLRGKSFEYRLVLPGGLQETLLSVPRWDFNWQTTYVLEEPRRVPAGARIDCVARFDNSAGNPNNPNPLKFVSWGDQTWEEMMVGFLDYYFSDGEAPRPKVPNG